MGTVTSLAYFRRERTARDLSLAGCSPEVVSAFRRVNEFLEQWARPLSIEHRDIPNIVTLKDLPVDEGAAIVAIVTEVCAQVPEAKATSLVMWSPNRADGSSFAALWIPRDNVAPWRHRAVDKKSLTLTLPAESLQSKALVILRVEEPEGDAPAPEAA